MSAFRVLADGARVPALGLGTWGFGGREQPDDTRDDESVSAIQTAISLGFTHIDMAAEYGAGHCEELVGRAIQGADRGKLFVTTRVPRGSLSRRDLAASAQASLKRLGVDQLDLLLVGWPNPEVPLRETMRALEECYEEGLTAHIGVSNFSAQLMYEAQGYLRESWIAVNESEFSLLDQKPRMELLPACRKTGVLLVAYRPLGHGILARPGNPFLDGVAERYGKTRSQVALNWVVDQEGVAAVPKSGNPVHLMELAGATGWSLEAADREALAGSFS